MKNTNAAVKLFCLLVLLCSRVAAQGGEGAGGLKHFSDRGLSFDYPAGVTLEDRSGASGQQLLLVVGQHGAQIMIISRFETIGSQEQFEKTRREMTDIMANALLSELSKGQGKPERSDVQIDVAGARASGVRYRAVLGDEPGAAEIYTLLLGNRLVMLTLIGSDKEIAAAADAWAVVRRSLHVGPATAAASEAARAAPVAYASGVLPDAVAAAGSLSGSTYTNSFLGLSLTIPAGWQVQSAQVRQEVMSNGRKVITSNDPRSQAGLDASVTNSATLLLVTRYPASASTPFNASLFGLAERLPAVSTGSTDAQYVTQVKSLLQQAAPRFVATKDIYAESFGGTNFAALEVRNTDETGTTTQTYYSHLKNGYALSFIITYRSEEDAQTLRSALQTVRLS